MAEITIITNHHKRDVLFGIDLTEKEKADFDYIKPEDMATEEFVRFYGDLYHLGDMERSTIPGWDAMVTETFFSGIVFRWTDGFEQIVCGRYYV